MKFKGYGSVYNPIKKKMVVNFSKTPEYETNDDYEIELLRKSGYITEESGAIEIKETIVIEEKKEEQTKKQVMASLDAMDIEYNPRDKKEVLLKLLEV